LITVTRRTWISRRKLVRIPAIAPIDAEFFVRSEPEVKGGPQRIGLRYEPIPGFKWDRVAIGLID
jgi:hypothetical protein